MKQEKQIEYEQKNKEQILINLIKDKLSELEEEIREEAFRKVNIINELKNRVSVRSFKLK